MAETIGTAYIQIEPTTQGIGGKISNVLDGEAEKAGTSAGSKLSGALGNAAKLGGVAIAGITTAFAGATAGIINGAKATAEYGDNIDKMSQKLGVSAGFYQEWDAVLQHSGTSMDSMGASFKKLALASQNASDDQVAAFARLGLSLEQVEEMSAEDLFTNVIAGLQDMEEGTLRTETASLLLGKGAMELGALLNTSAEDTQSMIDKVHELGGVMSDDAVKNAAAFQDSLQDMQSAFAGVKNKLMADFLPSITTVMDGLGKLASGDKSGLGQIKDGIKEFLQNLSNMIPDILKVGGEIIQSLASAIMENLPQIANSAIDVISTLIDKLTDNLPEVIEMGIELIVKLIVGISKAIPKLIEKAPDIIKAIVKGLISAMPELLSAGKDMVEGIWNGIKSAWEGLKNRVKSLAGDLVNSVKNFFKIGSPSKLFRDEIGQWIPAGIAVGIEGNTDVLEDSMKTMQSALAPEQLSVASSYAMNYDTTSNGNDGVFALLNEYLPQLANMQMVTETGAMVGALAPKMDKELGRMASMRSRYV